MTNRSAIDRAFTAFTQGQSLTARQLAARYGVANPYDLVHRLRSEGVRIKLTTTTNSKGRETRKYSLA